MCGRFSLQTTEEAIREQCNATVSEPIPNSTNLAPTEFALCIVEKNNERIALPMRWGFTPWYANGKKILLLNARSEDIATKAAFKQSVESRRCLLLMNGFFEWQHHPTDKKQKQPFLIHRKDEQLMAIAAIWQKEQQSCGTSLLSCCLLTTEAKGIVSKLHNRMPLMLSSEQQREWLADLSFDQVAVNHVLEQDNSIELSAYPVTTAMNSALYKAPDAILPI